MQGTKRTIKPGERVRVIGSYSEVMCHIRLAGKPVEVELLRNEYGDGSVYYSAQVHKDGRPVSAPITYGEAGIYRDGDEFYTYEAPPDDTGDEDPDQVFADIRQNLEDAITASGAPVTTITSLGL